jgi:hypothetical protein
MLSAPTRPIQGRPIAAESLEDSELKVSGSRQITYSSQYASQTILSASEQVAAAIDQQSRFVQVSSVLLHHYFYTTFGSTVVEKTLKIIGLEVR